MIYYKHCIEHCCFVDEQWHNVAIVSVEDMIYRTNRKCYLCFYHFHAHFIYDRLNIELICNFYFTHRIDNLSNQYASIDD